MAVLEGRSYGPCIRGSRHAGHVDPPGAMSDTVEIAILLLAIASTITSIELLRADGWRGLRRIGRRVTQSDMASALRALVGRGPDTSTDPRRAVSSGPDETIDADELSYRI